MDDSEGSVISARRNVLEKLYHLAMRGNVPAAVQFLERTGSYESEVTEPPEIYEEETEKEIPEYG